MIDVGNGTGFSREASGSSLFTAGRAGGPTGSRHGAASSEEASDAGLGGLRAAGGEPVRSNEHVLGPAGSDPARALIPGVNDAVRSGFPGDLVGLDFAALQALTGAGFGSGIGSGDQAAAIARQVADMAQGLAALADKLAGQPQPAANDMAEADCVAFIESQFRIRRLRARHLAGLSLGEPAWDILLDLTIAQYWRRETSVTSLCIAADVPSTTALRWISGMTKAGLIVRRSCQRDGRRSFLAISPETNQAMLALAADALRTEARVRARYQRAAAG